MTGDSVRHDGLFSGLRFLPVGFEENLAQLEEEILENKGQIAKRYDSSCTHVVVSNITYNDPICAAARTGGTTLVTEAWVSDCVNADTVVDANSILYRPLKDLDGIPGSENLCMCLTGYQGADRQKIMRMVDLMGSKFTKPLVGSLVTHLICYKFEGEKYELAKRTGLKLVNHFWLEDCLKAWALLPESDYAQSGWEAETMKAAEEIAEDSAEDGALCLQNKIMRRETLCEQVASPAFDQNSNGKNANFSEHYTVNKTSKESKTQDITAKREVVLNSGAEHLVNSEIGHPDNSLTNISHLENINTVDERSSENPPLCSTVWGSEKCNKGSVLHARDDVITNLYMEEWNSSIQSRGRTAYEEINMKVQEPVNTLANFCVTMDMMDVPTKHGAKRGVSSVEDLSTGDCNLFGDEAESPGSKRRCLQSGINVKAFIEDVSFPSRGVPTDSTQPFVLEEAVCFNSDQNGQAQTVDTSSVKQDILTCPSNPLVADLQTSSGMEKSATSCGNKAEFVKPVQTVGDDGHSPQESLNTKGDGHTDGDAADLEKKTQGSHEGVKPISSPHSTCTDEKEVVGRRYFGKTSVQPLIIQIEQSHNPMGKEQGINRQNPETKDKENLPPNESKQIVRAKVIKKKPVTQKLSKLTAVTSLESSKKCFAVSGATDERARLHSVIKMLGGKVCKSRHQWRDEATHVVLPGPLRRTEKFLAGAAGGRWILKPEYLEASRTAGKLLEEEAYEWNGDGTNDKGTISLEAPRKWRILRATSNRGAFHDLTVLFYGECISPPLDTLKRAIKAGGGLILATAPPYTRHLPDGVNFAIISPGIPKDDYWVKEFLKHNVACVTSEYLVDLVCHPSSSLENHILYETTVAVKAAQQLQKDSLQFGRQLFRPTSQRDQHNQTAQSSVDKSQNDPGADDVSCLVCGRLDDEEVMLLCGDDKGGGCGAGMHIHCCRPPLQTVPDEDWFCPNCES